MYIYTSKWHNSKRVCWPFQEKLETQVRSLCQEDLLKEGMATHSSILAWKDDLVSYSPWGCKRVGHDLVTEQHTLQETE